jgi:hypothetical protein
MFFSLNLIKNVWFGSCNKTKESKKQKYTQKYHFQISMKALKAATLKYFGSLDDCPALIAQV